VPDDVKPDPPGTGDSALVGSAPARSGSAELYGERLTVPIAWWVLSGLFALSLLLAFGLYLGPAWGVGSALVCMLALGAIFAAAGVKISITPDRLWVGRANIELRYVGEPVALDAAGARQRRGPQADARAFLALRPYIATAVEVPVTDVDDPAPYWLVATRRPRALAEALSAALAR
jgi:hypothetical protein